ncbi:MAG: DUF3899 domain-containing protein [Anaerobacillus sp.]
MWKFLVSLILSVVCSVILWGSEGIGSMKLVNESFYWGIIGLTVGAFLLILRTGFLSLLFEGFYKLQSLVTPRSRAMQRVDDLLKEDHRFLFWKERVMATGISLCFGIGTGLSVLSCAGVLMM